jgi:transcriptional regulator with XRE-family HTH domain
MKKGAFGETLRREREMRGVSLEEVANATRISTRNLEALENERWEQLPGGVFNRGFVRSIARFLGLDEDTLVSEYAIATNDPPQVAVWMDRPVKPRRSLLPWLLAAMSLVLLAAAWFAWQERNLLSSAIPGTDRSAAAAPPPAPGPAPPAGVTTLELKVDAAMATTATVRADGIVVFDGRMLEKDSRRFQAKERFEVSAGDSFALLLELNGQAVAPLGRPGEPGRITLTRNDLRKPEGQD